MHKSNHSNTAKNNCIISNAQNTTAKPSVCVRRLLVTNKGLSGLPSKNHCLSQLLTPQPATNTSGVILLKIHNYANYGIFIELLQVIMYVVNNLVVYFVYLKMF